MKVVVGIDLGSTTTKAVLLDEHGVVVGRGITNSRSNYEVACAVARDEALTATRFALLEREVKGLRPELRAVAERLLPALQAAFRLELYVDELKALRGTLHRYLTMSLLHRERRAVLIAGVDEVLDGCEAQAPALFALDAPRKSDFFRDLAGAAFVAGAEKLAQAGQVGFEELVSLFDRAILEVETSLRVRDMGRLLKRGLVRLLEGEPVSAAQREELEATIDAAAGHTIDEVAFVGTGYGRQTLPFPKDAIRSEILCHGRGAHRVFPNTRTVLDIGGQDTKAIQVDANGVVTGFQMNDRCAAGCGRYLGYIADELSLGLHELGPLALQATRTIKVCSTCTVFAGAELRERLALGQKREDILAGLHRAIMLRAMSLLARSGGVANEFTFTGGVGKNPMATKLLRELVDENYGGGITLNLDPASIYMGALGAALYGMDDATSGRSLLLPTFAKSTPRLEAP